MLQVDKYDQLISYYRVYIKSHKSCALLQNKIVLLNSIVI